MMSAGFPFGTPVSGPDTLRVWITNTSHPEKPFRFHWPLDLVEDARILDEAELETFKNSSARLVDDLVTRNRSA